MPDGPRANTLVVAAFVGMLTSFVSVPLTGISAAIASPAGLFPWARAHGVLEPALFGWDFLVVDGFGVGFPTLVALAVLHACLPQRRPAVIAFAAGILLGLYVLAPASYLVPLDYLWRRRWWSYGRELALAAALGLAWAAGGGPRTGSRPSRR